MRQSLGGGRTNNLSNGFCLTYVFYWAKTSQGGNDSPTFLGCVTWLYGYHWGVVVPAGTMPLLCWASSLSLQVSRSIQLLKSVQKVAWTLRGGDSCCESISHRWGPSSHSRKPESGCGLGHWWNWADAGRHKSWFQHSDYVHCL